MNSDERIKKKLGKLLTKWSVPDAEKVEFLKELEDEIAKPDEEEDLEGVAEETEEVKEESPEVGEEEVEEVSEDAEVPAEPEPTEEVAEPTEEVEEPVAEEPAEVPSEKPLPEQPMEEPVDQPQPVEQPQENNDLVAELQNTISGLVSRIESLEDTIKKLGAPVEDNVGVEPHNPSGESLQESEMERINRIRMGR